MIFLIIIVILALAAEIFIAEKCLQMIVHPIRQDYARSRKVTIDEGFGDCLDAYDKKWDRKTFRSTETASSSAARSSETPMPEIK